MKNLSMRQVALYSFKVSETLNSTKILGILVTDLLALWRLVTTSFASVGTVPGTAAAWGMPPLAFPP